MKNLSLLNFKSAVRRKARWLITLIAILTLGVGETRAASTVNGGYIYFDELNSGYTGAGDMQFWVGHSGYSSSYTMSKITNTKLWYCSAPSWGDATYFAFTSGANWGAASQDYYTRIGSYTWKSAKKESYTVNSGSYYVFKAASTANKAAVGSDSPYGYKGTGYSSLNSTQTFRVQVTTNGGSSYSNPATAPASLSYSSKTFGSASACNTNSSGSITAGNSTVSSTASAGFTATTTLTYSSMNSDYTFVCWHDGSSSVGTGTTYTYYPTAATTITARFTQNYPSGKVLYLKPNADWKSDGARFAAYFYGATGNTWVNCSRVGESDYWSVTVPDGYRGYVIFCRMNGADATNDFNDSHRWNQTSSLMYDASYNGVEITGWNESQNRIAVATATITGTYHYFPGETISLTVTPMGDDGAAKTYQWYKGGTASGNAISGATSATYTKASCTYADMGAYYCKVTWGSVAHWADGGTAYNLKMLHLYVNGSRNGEPYGDVNFTKVDGTTATATMNLGLLWTYGFSISDGCGNYYGNTGTMTESNCTNWLMDVSTQCAMTTTNATNYTFTVNYSNLAAPVVSITYPEGNQAASKTIYFDNNVLKWANVWYRIGRSNHSQSTAMTKVSGTANLYKVTTTRYDGFYSWIIANAQGGTGDNKSIYNTKNTPEITASTNYIGDAVTATSVTVTPGSSPSTGGTDENNNCSFYGETITSGMKTDAVTITAPTNGTITVSYTNTSGSAASFTSGSQNLAHTVIITPTATPATGYDLSGLTVNEAAHTSGNTYTVTAATTIAATFTPHVYSITYKDQGNVAFSGTHVDTPNAHPTSHTYATATTLNGATKTGYKFEGWYTNSACTGDPVTTLGATAYTANITLYAKWTLQWYVVGSGELGAWTVPGTHAIGNISTAAGETTGYVDITLSARTTYEMKLYDIDGLSGPAYVGYENNTLESTPLTYANSGTRYTMNTYPGYNIKFRTAGAGTYRFTRVFGTNKLTITYPMTAYTVTYNGNGSTGGTLPATEYYNTGETVTAAAQGTLVKSGYTFGGWNKANDGSGTNYTAGSGTFTISANTTLYAKWTQSVTLNQNGATTDGSTSVTMTLNSASHGAITNPSKTGYTFGGWTTGSGGTGTVVINTSGVLQANVTNYTGAGGIWTHAGATTLYAKWTANPYTITLNGQSPTSAGTTSIAVTYDANTNLTSAITKPTKDGYTFQGYYTGTGGSGTQIINSSGNVIASVSGYTDASRNWKYADNITLYAKWTENTHTVTVASGGNGTVSPTSVSGVGVTTASSDITATPSTGYYFTGWTLPAGVTAAGGYTSTSNPIRINATADGKTITANFAPIWRIAFADTYGGTAWNTDLYPINNLAANGSGHLVGTVTRSNFDGHPHTSINFKVFNARDNKWYGVNSNGYGPNGATNTGSSGSTIAPNYTTAYRCAYLVRNGGSNIAFTTAGCGTYTFTWDTTDYKLTVTYPTTVQINADAYKKDIDNNITKSTIGGSISSIVASCSGTLSSMQYYSGSSETMTVTHSVPETGYTWVGWYSNSGNPSTQWTAGANVTINDAARTIALTNRSSTTYANGLFQETATTITLNSTAGGHIERNSETITSINVGVTSTRDVTAVAEPGYYFTGWTKTSGTDYSISSTSAATTTITGGGAGSSGQVLTANFALRWTVTGNTAALGNWATPGSLVLGNISTSAGVTTGYVDVSLAAHTSYEIKMWDKAAGATKYVGYATDPSEINYSNSGTAYNLNTYPGYNFKFLSAGAGTYRITRDMTNNKVIITYPTAYTVTYHGNGSTSGSVPVDAVYYGSGETVYIPANLGYLAKTDYTLSGWNTDEHITGTTYGSAGGESFTITANTNLYAKWTHAISLDKNGGTGSSTVTATYNSSTLTDWSAPTKTGYTFAGYWTSETSDNGSGTLVINTSGVLQSGVSGYTDASGNWTSSTARTLYAKWTENSYSVTFYNGGHGTVAVAGATIANGGSATITQVNSKTLAATADAGYDFNGWSQTGGASIANTSLASTSITATATGTVTANWTAHSYTISYDLAGGSVATPNPTSYTIESSAITLNNPTKTGYTFAGWTGTGLAEATTTVTIAAGSTGDRSYTATWTANEYVVTLDPSPATNGSSSVTMTYNSSSHTAITNPSKTGYTFGGWYTGSGGTGTLVINTSGVLQANVSEYTGAGGVWIRTAETTLYAKFTAKSCTVNFDKQDGTGGTNSVTATYASAMPTITTPTKDGYTFQGYWDAVGGGGTQYYKSNGTSQRTWNKNRTSAISLYAKWTQDITLNQNGATTSGSTSLAATYNAVLDASSITNPVKTGYTFGGWTTGSGGTGDVVINASKVVQASVTDWTDSDKKWKHAGASTLYAKWTEDTHTVTVAAGANGSVDPTSVTAGITTASGTITATPNTGYHFDNWTIPAGVTIASGSTTSPSITINATADDLTITANFAVSSYDVTLNTNGGTINAGNVTSYTYGVGATLPTNVTKTGYTFGGWYDNSSLTGSAVTTISTTATGDKEFWAKWTANTNTAYTVNHYKQNLDGSYPVSPTETDNLEGTTGASVTPARKSYTGFTAPSGTTVTIAADGSTVVNYNYTRNSYTLTWSTDGDPLTGSYTSGSTKFGASITAPNTPTKTNYVFAGWSPAVAATMPAANTTYTATWTDAVAKVQVGEGTPVYFATVADAITDANGKTNPTVTILKTASVASQVEITATMTINLNGKTVSSTVASGTGVFKINASGKTVTINGAGGTISHTAAASVYGLNVAAGTLNMTGGTVTVDGGSGNPRGIYVRGSSTNTATVSLTDVTVESTSTGSNSIAVYSYQYTDITIHSGTYKATASSSSARYAVYARNGTGSTITIEGGKFNGADKDVVKAGDDASITITGGYYVHNTNIEGYCATNYHVLPASLEEGGVTYNYKVVRAYTLTWDLAGGSISSAGTAAGYVEVGATVTAPTVTKTGYTFASWSPSVVSPMPAADKTYTATWSANTYDVTLNTNGGTINAGNVTSYTYGVGATLPTNVTKTGYTFGGWYDNSSLTGSAVTTISTTATGDKEFWAKWTANTNTAYTVNHYKQNLDGTYPGSPTETDNLEGTTGASVTPARKSYTGFTAPGGTTVTIAADGSTVVNYNYTRNSYTLTWSTDGDPLTGSYTSGSTKFGASITAPNTPTKDNFVFAGWSPDVAATMPAANTTYTATWTAAVAKVQVGAGTPTYYTTVADAITAANALTNPTVTILQTTSTSQVEITAAMTIDLNGKTVSSTAASASSVFKINASGKTVIITDGLTGGTINHTANYSGGYVYGVWLYDGTLNMTGGTIHAENTNSNRAYGIFTNNSADAISISGGTVEAVGSTPFSIYTTNACNLTMTGGTITASGTNSRGIYVRGTTSLTNATITTSASDGIALYAKAGSMTIHSGTYSGNYALLYEAGSVTVNGGRFNGTTQELVEKSGASYGSNVHLQGGYYVHNTDLAGNCTAPYHVFDLAGESPYLYEVATGYTLTWTTDGDPLTGDYTKGTTKVGTTIVAPNTPTKTGYTFSAWSPSVESPMPASDKTYTATWTTEALRFTTAGNWNTPSNWTPACVPTAEHDVIIQKPCSVDVANAAAKSVVIYNNGSDKTGSLNIGATKGLNVTGTIQKTTNGSTYGPTSGYDLVLESSASGNASLVFNNSNGCQAWVLMYSKGNHDGSKWNWQYVGTPFTGTIANPNYAGSYLYKWKDATSTETFGWTNVTNENEIEPWVGYCLTQPSPVTLEMEGTLMATDGLGDVTRSFNSGVVSYTPKVLANSWTAPIQITQMTPEDFTNVQQTIYLFNTGKATAGEAGDIADNNTAAGTYTSIPRGTAGTGGIPDKISSMQGFYVKKANAEPSASITLNYGKHVRPSGAHTIDQGPMRAPKQEELKPQWMKIIAQGSRYASKLYLFSREDFTYGFDDGWDGENINDAGVGPLMYSPREDGTKDAISAIPEFEGAVVGFEAGEDSEYTFSFTYEGDEEWYLNDLHTWNSTRISAENTYTFGTTDNDDIRFVISAQPLEKMPEGIDDTNAEGARARKLLIRDKLYIILNGRIYDGTGKIVMDK